MTQREDNMSIITSIWSWIKNLWSKAPIDKKKAVHIGVVVTELVKVAVDSVYADIITALIPGDTDDKIKVLLRNNLPGILIKMRLVGRTLSLTDPEEIAQAALQTIKELGGLSQEDAHTLSILVAQVAADGKLDWSDGVYLLQWYYENEYKNLK